DLPVEFAIDRAKLREDFVARHFRGDSILNEAASKALIETYGIPTTRPHAARTVDEAATIANRIGYPVVIKILSPDITHKTDVGGVALSLEDEAMLRNAFDRMMVTVSKRAPHAKVEGVTVQTMVSGRDSIELILGIKKDATFGTVMMIGMGGIGAELLGERSLGFPPLNERLARRMLESLRIWPMLQGYRGRPAVDVKRLIEILVRMSYLAADYPEIAELDINPLVATPHEIVALDARVIIDRSLVGKSIEPYAHLALRPYPERYVKQATLRDGTGITLRPIKPEDEPLWLALLASCTKESIYSRFRYFFHWNSHEVATRFCYIDYDREIAIVAEIIEDGARKIIGVGRLIADPDHETVEYAVLITDAWQKKEVGSILTDFCMEIAEHWKLKRVVAQTTTDNRPMVSVFEKRGFTISYDGTDVYVVKELN
ncbi:MAG: GNAT family N-acetyltransferase, partial [candidate division Zixibacteria bacterium]|nr:GNAT family N-acetyltransferase [candidate division Zixibacteria bacterium]